MQVLQLDDLDFCRITKKSILTGKENVMFLPVTKAEVDAWLESGDLVQDRFSHLSASAREFLISGATHEEWKKIFPNCTEQWLGD